MSLEEGIGGAVAGSGLMGLLAVGLRVFGRDRREARKTAVEAAKVEAKREETGTHATERAFDDVKSLLADERELRRQERDHYARQLDALTDELDAMREANAGLIRSLTEALDLVCKQQGEIDRQRTEIVRLRNEVLRRYVDSERP